MAESPGVKIRNITNLSELSSPWAEWPAVRGPGDNFPTRILTMLSVIKRDPPAHTLEEDEPEDVLGEGEVGLTPHHAGDVAAKVDDSLKHQTVRRI